MNAKRRKLNSDTRDERMAKLQRDGVSIGVITHAGVAYPLTMKVRIRMHDGLIDSKVFLPTEYPKTRFAKQQQMVASASFGLESVKGPVPFKTLTLESLKGVMPQLHPNMTPSEAKWLRGIARRVVCRTLAILLELYPEARHWMLLTHALGHIPGERFGQDGLVKMYEGLGLRRVSGEDLDILAAPLPEVCARRNAGTRNAAARLIQRRWRATGT